MNQVYAILKKGWAAVKSHWPAILVLLTAIWEKYGGQVTAFVAVHPKYTFWFSLASFLIAFYLKSPRQKGT